MYMRDSVLSSGTERKIFLWTEKRQRVDTMWFGHNKKTGYLRGRVTEVLYPAERQNPLVFWESVLTTMGSSPPLHTLLGSFSVLVDSYKASRAAANVVQKARRRAREPEPGGTGDVNRDLGMECFVCGTHGSNGKRVYFNGHP
jgi:hypothetical protein